MLSQINYWSCWPKLLPTQFVWVKSGWPIPSPARGQNGVTGRTKSEATYPKEMELNEVCSDRPDPNLVAGPTKVQDWLDPELDPIWPWWARLHCLLKRNFKNPEKLKKENSEIIKNQEKFRQVSLKPLDDFSIFFKTHKKISTVIINYSTTIVNN